MSSMLDALPSRAAGTVVRTNEHDGGALVSWIALRRKDLSHDQSAIPDAPFIR